MTLLRLSLVECFDEIKFKVYSERNTTRKRKRRDREQGSEMKQEAKQDILKPSLESGKESN